MDFCFFRSMRNEKGSHFLIVTLENIGFTVWLGIPFSAKTDNAIIFSAVNSYLYGAVMENFSFSIAYIVYGELFYFFRFPSFMTAHLFIVVCICVTGLTDSP